MTEHSSPPKSPHPLLPGGGGGGWLSKVLGALLAVGIIVASAFLAAFFFGFFLVLVALASIWLAWQRWRLRRWVRANQHANTADQPNPHQQGGKTRIIMGEYEVVDEPEHTQKPHRQTQEQHTRQRREP